MFTKIDGDLQMNSNKFVLGLNSLEYNEHRNIIVPSPAFVDVKKVLDLMKIVDFVYFKIFKKNHPYFHNVYCDWGIKRADLFHFYNAVSLGKRPWFVTFENETPRHNPRARKLYEKLAGDACKGIFAMTQNAYNIEVELLNNFPDLKEKILSKISLLAPPQKLHVAQKEFDLSKKIHFTFVGGAFFHKGGKEMLLAFIRALSEAKNIHLNIVSSFAFTFWYDSEYGNQDIEEMKNLMAKHTDNISYFPYLANEEIIALFKKSHVGLLPSFGETYGYSVLEAQSCGCPVITTNAWAFSEFNSNEAGWILDLPTAIVNGGLRCDIGTADKKLAYSKLMTEKLYETFLEIARNPECIPKKSEKAIQNIRDNHDVEKNKKILSEHYQKALERQ